jgi:DNA (cytosine-5)-methyltransferase 1
MKYLSLFSGIGGLEYGLNKRAGCIGISEIKESSIKIYEKNYGKINNFGDIIKMDFSKLPDFDILIGGFPCQSFSMAGLRKGFADTNAEKGKMIFYIYELLKEKKPYYVVLENVKGIISHNNGKTIIDIVRLLSSLNYFVRIVLLNALNYGTAQNRERVFFICSKKDFKIKEPIIKDNSVLFRQIRDNRKEEYRYVAKTDFNLQKIEQKRLFNFELIGGYDRVGTLTTQEGCGEKLVYEEGIDDYRYLTPLECERLQGFPDNWTDGIGNNDRYFALGNAVNCKVSDYLFNDYLPSIWEDF